MKRFAALALTAALCLAVAGCQNPRATAPPSQAMVSAADAGQSVTLAVGGTLTVALPANPSTGYSWVPTNTPEFLVEQGQPSFETTGAPANVGADGTEVILFKAVGAGSGTLALDYLRPWETSSTPAKRYTVKVEAQ